ncbi:MAG: PUA domain-containing protein [Thermoplasmata archaeon]
MATLRFRKRRRLRRKEVAALSGRLEADFGRSPFSPDDSVDRAEGPAYDVLYEGGDIVGLLVDEVPVPTVRGLLRTPPSKRYVTVDAGAVPFVYNGADVMAPGIVEADPAILPGEFVWVRDEANGVPLAVGRALLPGEAMRVERQGKAVEALHHVGDRLWKLGEA